MIALSNLGFDGFANVSGVWTMKREYILTESINLVVLVIWRYVCL